MRGAIKRLPAAERKLQRALCPIHTTRWMKPADGAHRRLTGFKEPARTTPGTSSKMKTAGAAEPYRPPAHLILRTAFCRPVAPWASASNRSDQDEVDQRDQTGRDAGSDQRIVNADVDGLLERRSGCSLGHSDGLGQENWMICEPNHICPIFFPQSPGTGFRRADW
jgi:hypothetical protein